MATHSPTEPEYGDFVCGIWLCDRTVFCDNLSPTKVRDGELEWIPNEHAFRCPICRCPMEYEEVEGVTSVTAHREKKKGGEKDDAS